MAMDRWCLSVGKEINPGVTDWLNRIDSDRPRWLDLAKKIHKNASAVCQQLGLSGTLELFGSAASGFGSSTSDVDLVFVTAGYDAPSSLAVLQLLEGYLRDSGLGLNITQIYQGRAPVLKITHGSGIEVDIVVNNHLGISNTKLFKAYHDIDVRKGDRIGNTVRALKEWARRCGLIGTCDGMINSFAFTILVLYYLQVVGVLPNLQALAVVMGLPSEIVEKYETRFADATQAPALPAGSAAASAPVGSLMYGFFQFYSEDFDWTSHAVSMRLAAPHPHFVPKADLKNGSRSQWYIEDPFQAGFNLAHGTSQQGRDRMLNAFWGALQELQAPSPEWRHLCPEGLDKPFSNLFLKLRLKEPRRRADVPRDVWQLFNPYEVSRMYVRTNDPEAVEVYLQFDTWQKMRAAQGANEQTVACCDHPVALYISLGHGLMDDVQHFRAYPGGGAAESVESLAKLFPPLPFPRATPMSSAAAAFDPSMPAAYRPPMDAPPGTHGSAYPYNGGGAYDRDHQAYGGGGGGAYAGGSAYPGHGAFGGAGAYGGNAYENSYNGYGNAWSSGQPSQYPPYYGDSWAERGSW